MVKCGHKTFKESLQVLRLVDSTLPVGEAAVAHLAVAVAAVVLIPLVVVAVPDPVVVADTDKQ